MSDIPPPIQSISPPEVVEEEPELVPLDRLPTPPFVLILCGVTLLAFVIGLVRFPSALAVGIDYEKGQQELAAGKNKEAVTHLDRVYKIYPKSVDVRLDMADAFFRNAQYAECVNVMRSFDENEKVSKEQSAKFDEISSLLDSKAHELGLDKEGAK